MRIISGVLPGGTTPDDFTFRALSHRHQGDPRNPAKHARRIMHTIGVSALLCLLSQRAVYSLRRAWSYRGRVSSIWPRARHTYDSKPYALLARKRG